MFKYSFSPRDIESAEEEYLNVARETHVVTAGKIVAKWDPVSGEPSFNQKLTPIQGRSQQQV
jgi:hypothetical protein